MEEIAQVLKKYDEEYVRQHFADAASINAFALTFYKDAADIYDAVTRVRNLERNPHGFDLHDAPILGLLGRELINGCAAAKSAAFGRSADTHLSVLETRIFDP